MTPRLTEFLKTLGLALLTVTALHVALTVGEAQARTAEGCPHGACLEGGLCGPYANHHCCFGGGGCTSLSCLLSPDGCP